MTHRPHRPTPAKRIFASLDSDYGPPTDHDHDPRNDWRDADDIYADEVNAARFAEQMRVARRKQQEVSRG
jgi:hypothetical protein